MRTIRTAVMILFALWLLSGCTQINYRADGSISYLSVLQRKQFTVEREASGVWKATYNTDSNAAVEMAQIVERLAQMAKAQAVQ